MNWDEAIIFARTTLSDQTITQKEIFRLQENCKSIDNFIMIIRLLYQDSKTRPVGLRGVDYLFTTVDKSIYSLKDWIEGICYFQTWLEDRSRTGDFRKMLGYLQCCEDSPEVKDTRTLFVDLISDMLSTHDFIG